jgi:hypothetical protein
MDASKIVDGKHDDIHVVPNWEDHESSSCCWCCPTISYQDPVTHKRVYSHNAASEGGN